MADLPPSYDETIDITESTISYSNNAYSVIHSNGSPTSITTFNNMNMPASGDMVYTNNMNKNVSLPTTYVNRGIYVGPEIVVNDLNIQISPQYEKK